MRLVVIATRQGDRCPFHHRKIINEAKGPLKANNPAKQLRRQSNFIRKQLNETPRAKAHVLRQFRDRPQRPLATELAECKGNGGMPRQSLMGLSQQC